jgi:UDP-N-acetylmuramoylalanine--D-glutamate ligase
MENLGFASSVMFVNDSKATNSDASMQALNTYSNIFWILGGKSKSDGIESLIPYFKNVSKSYLIGESAPKFHKTLTKHKVNHKISGTLEKAIICATRDAMQSECPNPVVMLSPSCASFDQFENFAVRGDAFRGHVNKIINLFSQQENNVSKY